MKSSMKSMCICLFVGCFAFFSWQACQPPVDNPNDSGTPDITANPDDSNGTPEVSTDGQSAPTTGRKQNAELTEEATKTKFKGWMTINGADEPLFLMGTGVRRKIIIDVYAMGFYVGAIAAQKELKSWKGKSKDDLGKDDAFYAKLLRGSFTKMMRLYMTFNVSAGDMANAFKDSVEPRIKSLLKEADRPAAMKALDTFKGYFDKPAAKGQEILFVWHADGKLEVLVDGTSKGTIANPGLALCLFDIYLGKDPISGDAKKNFADGMKELYP